VEAVRETVKTCGELGIEYLTLFAFSSENWRRPAEEVSVLMQLFLVALDNEVAKLHANGIRFKVIGDLTRFDARLRDKIAASEALTESNTALTLTVAANYGGRWDILQAMNKAQQERVSANREVSEFSEDLLTPYLSMAYAPEPDLFIRTGGEQRLSNFLIWQLAYTEFYFTPELWPDFGRSSLIRAVDSYGKRERRFGRTSDQLAASLGISSDCTSDAA
jgi:undecaprenyl diphosphate synthase